MNLILAATGLFAFTVLGSASDAKASAPVLVELFTSEGCSSCPPADTLLEVLDRTQPVSGAEIIVLSEHVDYWNQIGWTDPFSSRGFSERQQFYAKRFGLEGAYTPQMVVNGTYEFVGSDKRRAISEIAKAAASTKAAIRITASSEDPFRVHIEADAPAKSDVFVALALNDAVSQVTRGENSGRQLKHVAVVTSLTQIGKTTGTQRFVKDLDVAPGAPADPRRYRIVAFVQEHGQGRILAAAKVK